MGKKGWGNLPPYGEAWTDRSLFLSRGPVFFSWKDVQVSSFHVSYTNPYVPVTCAILGLGDSVSDIFMHRALDGIAYNNIPPFNPYTASHYIQDGIKIPLKTSVRFHSPVKLGSVVQNTWKMISPYAGRIAPVVGGAALGYLAAKSLIGWMHIAEGATEYIDNVARQLHGLELGGLGQGYQSREAATERQRLQYEVRNSSNGPRRFLGSEASIMSGLL